MQTPVAGQLWTETNGRLSLDALAAFLETSLDGVVIVDAERRYVYLNPVACDIMGCAREELIGRDLLNNFALCEHRAVLENLSDQQGRFSSLLLRPDGQKREVEFSHRSFVVNGQPFIGAVIRDIANTRQQSCLEGALARIASIVALADSLEATLDSIAHSVVEATGIVACMVLLMDEKSPQSRLVGKYGLSDELVEGMNAACRAGVRPPGIQACRSQKPAVLRNARQMFLSQPFYAPIHDLIREVTWDTVVYAPLIYQGRLLGILNGYYPEGREPGEAEIGFLTVIAHLAAVAVENARLFDEAQGKAALEERQRLARELHDSVSQALCGIALGARTARAQLDRDPQQAVEPLDYVLSLSEAALAEMRALIFELRPDSLEKEGLVAALNKQMDSVRARHGIAVHAELGDEPELPFEVKEALYRIAQEALHNTVKHARASKVELRLEANGNDVALHVSDDGVGFDVNGSFPGHIGLQSMRERATRLGGTLEVVSTPQRGTQVRANVPRNPV